VPECLTEPALWGPLSSGPTLAPGDIRLRPRPVPHTCRSCSPLARCRSARSGQQVGARSGVEGRPTARTPGHCRHSNGRDRRQTHDDSQNQDQGLAFHVFDLINSRRRCYASVLISPRPRRSFRICSGSACPESRLPDPDPRNRNTAPQITNAQNRSIPTNIRASKDATHRCRHRTSSERVRFLQSMSSGEWLAGRAICPITEETPTS